MLYHKAILIKSWRNVVAGAMCFFFFLDNDLYINVKIGSLVEGVGGITYIFGFESHQKDLRMTC